MSKKYLLFYDSGIGGLTTMAETYLKVNCTDFLYFADDKNCPYGNKTADEIYDLVLSNILAIRAKYAISMIIIACNTATACTVEKLRKYFTDIIIIGTEPAIKPALAQSKTKNLLVIATALTLQQDKYRHLIALNKGVITSQKMPHLADKIERHFVQKQPLKISEEMKLIRKNILSNPLIDTLVLGCTHYSLIKQQLGILKLNIIDGNYGVAARVLSFNKDGEVQGTRLDNNLKFLLASGDKKKSQRYMQIFNDLLSKYKVTQ